MKGKNVLITGGLGFIGSNLAKACVEQGARVTVYDSLYQGCGGNLYNIQDIAKDIKFVKADILDEKMMRKHIRANDVLFNCAAISSHALSFKEPQKNFEVNSEAVLQMLEIVKKDNKDIRFIQVGTTTQFGPLKVKCANETHSEFPMDLYSVNKIAAEKYTLIYQRMHSLFACVIRLPNVFGPRAGINNIGLTFNNYFVGLALQNKEIQIYGDGKQRRNVLYVDDAVSALMRAAETKEASGHVFLAVADDHHTVAQIAKATVKYLESGRVRFIPWPADKAKIEVGHACFSNARIREIIGWKPECALEEGLLRTKAYYENCLPKYFV